MIFGGRVLDAKGAPLARGAVEMVTPKGREVSAIAAGKVDQGTLSLEADPGPVWGLRIDGRPVLATVASSDGRAADLGDLILIDDGVAWVTFHAPDGRIFGLPKVAFVEASLGRTTSPSPPSVPPIVTAVSTRGGLTFAAMLGSSAQQLNAAVTSTKGLQLAGANITIKGVPTATQDAIGLDFPNAELAAVGAGLSELSFALKPLGTVEPAPPVSPSGPTVPDLLGYTRELAARKLAALGLVTEVREEITDDIARAGRVVRQFPKPGETVGATTVVRVFVGKQGAA